MYPARYFFNINFSSLAIKEFITPTHHYAWRTTNRRGLREKAMGRNILECTFFHSLPLTNDFRESEENENEKKSMGGEGTLRRNTGRWCLGKILIVDNWHGLRISFKKISSFVWIFFQTMIKKYWYFFS